MAAKVSKYLTDMKELPPVAEEAPADMKPEPKPATDKPVKQEISDVQKSLNLEDKKKKDKLDAQNIESKKSEELRFDDPDYYETKDEKVITGRDIVLGVINLLCITVLIFILIKFPGKSQDLKEERNQMLINDAGFNFELSEVNQAKAKADEINKVFVDESGIVGFVDDLEKIKAKSGAIRKITFTSQKAIEDKQTGNLGIPVVIEFTGELEKILTDLDEIQKLPYVLRAITVQAGKNEEDPNVLDFKYGGFLYVDDSLGQNK